MNRLTFLLQEMKEQSEWIVKLVFNLLQQQQRDPGLFRGDKDDHLLSQTLDSIPESLSHSDVLPVCRMKTLISFSLCFHLRSGLWRVECLMTFISQNLSLSFTSSERWMFSFLIPFSISSLFCSFHQIYCSLHYGTVIWFQMDFPLELFPLCLCLSWMFELQCSDFPL